MKLTNLKRHHQALLIGGIILVAAAAGFYADYHRKIQDKKTLYQKIGEAAYGTLVKPDDLKPLPVPPDTIQKGRAVHVPILMYHHVGEVPAHADPVRRGLTVSIREFSEQVAWLKQQGYTAITLNDVYALSQKQPVNWPKKPILFTFDDGYADAFDNAIPILKQNGFIGVFAIITQYPGQVQGTNTYATWEQIVKAKADGMEIICHTQNHFDGSNPKFTANYIFENLTGCQQDIKDHLAGTEPFLIYPYGHYTPTYLDQAKKSGFVMGLTVHQGSLINLDNLMVMPRVRVNPNESLELFQKRVQ